MISVSVITLFEHAKESLNTESGCGFSPNTNNFHRTDRLKNQYVSGTMYCTEDTDVRNTKPALELIKHFKYSFWFVFAFNVL